MAAIIPEALPPYTQTSAVFSFPKEEQGIDAMRATTKRRLVRFGTQGFFAFLFMDARLPSV
jgi:hypothetical protein